MWRMLCRSIERRSGAYAVLRKLRKNEDGAPAIEFAIVAGPFLMLLFGLISIGQYFFTTSDLENAVDQGSRQLRTGQYQQNQSPTSAQDFKTSLCNLLAVIPCSEVTVNALSFVNYAAITPATIPSCVDPNGNLAAPVFAPGQQNAVMVVWVCYKWTMTQYLPTFGGTLTLGNMGDGSRLIQATTTFQTEPYQ